MAEVLRSVGLDVGTTTTQLIVSELTIENRASSFSVPEMEIARRQILYKSPVHFTPLLGGDLVDGDGIRRIVAREYENAGIRRDSVDTGAIIITGETSRKENARAVLEALSNFAGDFVVATAGPDLESILAAKGAGAAEYSERTGKTVLHMDIGGGTSNLALIRDGKIVDTGCLNVGGRLLKFDGSGAVTYISPVLRGIFPGKIGEIPPPVQLEALARTLTQALEMAAGLREPTELLSALTTPESGRGQMGAAQVISFSGGVADCIDRVHPSLAFGDMGPVLGQAIRRSRLCAGEYRLGSETIRATVIGAGCHSTQLSGSTVFHRGIAFPLKNLPVAVISPDEQESPDLARRITERLRQQEGTAVLALPGFSAAHYPQIRDFAEKIAAGWTSQPILIALEADMAKALGHCLALKAGPDIPILCIDRIRLTPGSYLDVGAPVAAALPVVIKTLILER